MKSPHWVENLDITLSFAFGSTTYMFEIETDHALEASFLTNPFSLVWIEFKGEVLQLK